MKSIFTTTAPHLLHSLKVTALIGFSLLIAYHVNAQSLDLKSTQTNAGIPTGPIEDLKALENEHSPDVKAETQTETHPGGNPNYLTTLDGSHLKTSTGYKTDSVNATLTHDRPLAGISCMGLGLAANWIKGQTDDLNFNYESVSASADCTLGHHKLLSSLGVLSRDDTRPDPQEKSAQTWIGRVGFEESYNKWTASVEAGHGVFADSLQTDYAVQHLIQGPEAQINLSVRPLKRVRASLIQKLFFFNDANRRTDGDLSVMYGLSPDWPWIWVGAGYERLTDSNSNQGHYWAPRVFEDIGPRIDLAVPIYGALSYLMGLNFNWFRDIDYGTGFGYYGTAKLQYGQSDGRHCYFGIESIESKQGAGKWSSLAWNAGVQWLF